MANEVLGSLVVRIESDLRSFNDGMNNVSNKVDGFGSTVKKLGGLIAGAFAVTAIGSFLKSTIADAAEAEDNLSQLNAVLESTGGKAGVTADQVTDLAASLQKSTKFSDDAVVAGSNLLLTFTSIGKDVFPAATETMLNMSQALGQDVKSSAIQLGKALNDPINGVSALSRVGVSFTEQQKEQIKTLQESGDIMGAQKVILAELNTEFGNAAKAAGETFSGKLEILKNQFGEIKESIGGILIPKLTEFLNWVTPNLPAIGDFFTNAFESIGSFITNNLIPAFSKLWEWIKPNIPAMKEIVRIAFDAIKTIFKGISDFITTYVLPIFVSLKDWFVENFPKIKDAVMQAYDYIKPHFDKLVATIKADVMPIIMGLLDVVKKAMPGIQAIFEIVFPILVYVIGLVIDAIGIFIEVVKGIFDFIKPGLDLVANLFSTVFGGIKKVIEGVQWVLDKFNGTPMKDKNATVKTSYISDYDDYGQPIYKENTPGASHITGYDDYGQPILSNALGTNNWRGGLTWVGEKGRELVNLPKGSQIISNKQSEAMVGQGQQSVVNNFYLSDVKMTDQSNIKLLARELYNLSQSRSRGSGVVTT